ncbi:MAG: endopolygalacturonase [Verrucomicrobia bacterium]|nr:endopolygalacturonase [Verrucomicrobiota bacterium]
MNPRRRRHRLGWGLGLLALPLAAASPSVVVVGEPQFRHRHFPVEVVGVPESEQAIYQTWCTGEIGLRIEGLADEPHRVELTYVEMAMSDPWRRVFDVVINSETLARDVCPYARVGNYHPLVLRYTVRPRAGAITYAQRRSAPAADEPAFCLLRVYDARGQLVAEESAYHLRPPDWDLRSYLDLTRVHAGAGDPTDRRAPPWKGTYKIHEGETDRLTAADVMGPDGIAYPNWTRVGIPGGIPDWPATLTAADYGAVPDDGRDDSAALQSAIAALERRPGGGVLFLPPGRYDVDRPVFIHGDHIVIRGAGPRRTLLVSHFSKRGEPPELHGFGPGGQIHPRGYYYVWLDPEDLVGLELAADGRRVTELARDGRWDRQIMYRFAVPDLLAVAPNATLLTVRAHYRDGTVRVVTQPLRIEVGDRPPERAYGSLAVISFLGHGLEGQPVRLVADGRRGDTWLDVAPGHGLVAGDRIRLDAPSTDRWVRLTTSARPGAQIRTNHYEITRVERNRLWLGEALRLDFPVIDGATVQRLVPLVGSGIEGLGFEQAACALVHAVMFEYGWECWARDVEIVHAGDKPLYMPHSKRCEVRAAVFDRVWYNFGGSGYVGWEHSFDCLMEDVTAYGLRHGPLVQWASSGNVIRRSVFHGSDAQWHAGWTNENLFEDLVVEASLRDGAYGNGLWASPPEDRGHGPNGPRNVVYNCDVSSPKAGLWMGGMNEAWLILHNRLVVGRGPAVVAKSASFDHVIRDNVFVLLDPQPAAVMLLSADCTGIELEGNRCYGPVGRFVGGAGRPALDRDNRIRPSGDISRPVPKVRSIYEWQQEHRTEIQAEQSRRAAARASTGQ